MKRQKLNLKLAPRTERTANGQAQIQARIYIGGNDIKIATGIYCNPQKWDSSRQRVKNTHPEAETINRDLASLELKISQAHQYAATNTVPFDRALIDRYPESAQGARNDSFFAFAETWLKNNMHRLAKGTHHQLSTELSKLRKYRPVVNFSDINRAFILGYEKYMLQELRNAPNTVQKTMKKLRMFLNNAVYEGTITANPFEGMKFRGELPKEIASLSEREMSLLENHRFAQPRLQKVANLFLLQCYTGMAYADLATLRPEHFTTQNDRKWICKAREKSDVAALIPVFPKTETILHALLFSETGNLEVPSIQKYNSYLKEIGGIVGLETVLTSHVGRKTAGMIMLNNGVRIEVVSRILGHTSVRTTERFYAKVRMQLIENATRDFKAFG